MHDRLSLDELFPAVSRAEWESLAERELGAPPGERLRFRTDEGLELLTGVKAGSVEEEDTIHWLASERLRRLARGLRRFGTSRRESAPAAAAKDES